MQFRVSIDRFVGQSKETALLLTESGLSLQVPRSLLPVDASPGLVLIVSIKADTDATELLQREITDLQNDLRKTDPGGNIEI